MAVTEDVIKGSDYEETKDGGSCTRVFKVDGLSGATIFKDAVSQVGLDYGAAHPHYPDLKVTKIKPAPYLNSRTQVWVYVMYASEDSQGNGSLPPEGVVSFSATAREVLTERYRDRSLIWVKPPQGIANAKKQIGRVTVRKSYGVLSYTKETPTNPEHFLKYLNTVNNAPFRGGDKWTWLCTSLEIEKFLRRRVYRWTVQLEYDEETYSLPCFWTDDKTGLVPDSVVEGYKPDVKEGDGYTNVLYYGENNFTSFNIPT